jgi:hypothetical protein
MDDILDLEELRDILERLIYYRTVEADTPLGINKFTNLWFTKENVL